MKRNIKIQGVMFSCGPAPPPFLKNKPETKFCHACGGWCFSPFDETACSACNGTGSVVVLLPVEEAMVSE